MRRYDEPIEVRKSGLGELGEIDRVAGLGGEGAPAQFLWRERLWQVRQVVAHWVETGAWWQGAETREVLGDGAGRSRDGGEAAPGAQARREHGGPVLTRDLLGEQEVWRVEAVRGRAAALATLAGRDGEDPGLGVFDLVLDHGTGRWRLAGCWD